MLNHFLQNYIKSGKKRITIYLSFIVSHLSFSEAPLRAGDVRGLTYTLNFEI